MYNVVMNFDMDFINKVNNFVKKDFIGMIQKKKLNTLIGINNKIILDVLEGKIEEGELIRIEFGEKINQCSTYKIDKQITVKSTIQPISDLAIGNTLWLITYRSKNKLCIKSIVHEDYEMKIPTCYKHSKDTFSFKINNVNLLEVKNKFNLEKNIC